jgi:CRISPR-associated protein Cmr6
MVNMLPLYAGHNAPELFRPGYNAGLWYDKFCNVWRRQGNNWTLNENKNKWITGLSAQKVGSKNLLEQFLNRLANVVLALNGQVRCFVTDWRFVTGLGCKHPVENGFTWHHLLGVPYLPGSSVKGVVRSWAESWSKTEPAVVKRIFGPQGTAEVKNVGNVIFFDALPPEPVTVQADIMTPHYEPYYLSQEGPQPPGDWFDPVLIPFLTVAPGQPFLFALAPRRANCAEDKKDCILALNWLGEALSTVGAGAKTASGYGRFNRRVDLEQKLEERRLKTARVRQVLEDEARIKSTPAPVPESRVRIEMEQDGYSSDPDRFMETLTTKWLDKMSGKDLEENERREIARYLANWYQKFKLDQWKKPNKKNSSKIKAIKSVLES